MAYEDLLMPWERGSEVMAFKRNKMLGDRFPWKLPFVNYYWDAREGVTASGERVSAWVDRKAGVSLAQGTGANQPILLPYSGTTYLWLPGVNGNQASAPDSAALSITGDIDIRCKVALDDWTPTSENSFVSKWAGSQKSYLFLILATGVLRLYWTEDGTTNINKDSTAAVSATDFNAKWVRVTLDVDNGAGGNDVKFYTSDDGVTWTQLGNTVTTAGTTSIFDSTSALEVGRNSDGVWNLSGKVYRAQIYNGIGGTLAFDANFSAVSEGATSFTESSSNGATVTINSTGSKPAQIVGSQQILFDGAAHYLATGALTLDQPWTGILVGKQVTWTSTDTIFDGATTNTGRLFQTGGASPKVHQFAGAETGDQSNWALNTNAVVACVFNGASSLSQVNLTAAVTGDAGASNPSGLTLACQGSGTGTFGNITAKAFALCNTAPSAARLGQLIRSINRQHLVFTE